MVKLKKSPLHRYVAEDWVSSDLFSINCNEVMNMKKPYNKLTGAIISDHRIDSICGLKLYHLIVDTIYVENI